MASLPIALAKIPQPTHFQSRIAASIALGAALAITSADADPGRGSASYALVHETTNDSSGGRSTSANYTLDDSGDSGADVATSANYTHRDGFAGQLIDPTSLLVTGAGSVSEHITRDLDAEVVYDDGTFDPDVPAAWSVESGPLASVSPTGLATPMAVYQNTIAWARADYLGLSDTHRIVVIDFIKDNFQTYAGDGINDSWQVSHFGIDSPDAGPTADPDGDSQDNTLEWMAGYDPTDANDFLSLLVTATDTIELSQVIPDRTYTLQRSTDLANWVDTGLLLTTSTTILDQALTDPAPPLGVRVFYKVAIED